MTALFEYAKLSIDFLRYKLGSTRGSELGAAFIVHYEPTRSLRPYYLCYENTHPFDAKSRI